MITYLIGLIAVLVGGFFWQREKAQKAESGELIAKTEAKDAALAEDSKQADASAQAAIAEAKRIEEERAHAETKDMTPDEVKKYWENK